MHICFSFHLHIQNIVSMFYCKQYSNHPWRGCFWVSLFNSDWLGPHWWNLRGATGLWDWAQIEVVLLGIPCPLDLRLDLSTYSVKGLIRKRFYRFLIWGIFQLQFTKGSHKERAWKELKDMRGDEGKLNPMKGWAMTIKQKLPPKGWRTLFVTTTPLRISFLGSTRARAPLCPIYLRLDVKYFPSKGLVRKKYRFWIWGICQLRWHERKKQEMPRKWEERKGKDMKGTEKTWMDILAHELKEKERQRQ